MLVSGGGGGEDFGLVLVPEGEALKRAKRSVDDGGESGGGGGDIRIKKKYQRLAHSVRVKSDIRYRFVHTQFMHKALT